MKKLAAAILCLLLVCCTALAEQEMSWQQMLQIATPSPIPPYLPTSTPEPTADPNADIRFGHVLYYKDANHSPDYLDMKISVPATFIYFK